MEGPQSPNFRISGMGEHSIILTPRQRESLEKLAKAQGTTVPALLADEIARIIELENDDSQDKTKH